MPHLLQLGTKSHKNKQNFYALCVEEKQISHFFLFEINRLRVQFLYKSASKYLE